ncbi:hypothetical protein DV20_32700 [Amycolatopsis rifamycinica]|uniref:Uncharacterized protein n=1 Tax=Amycolatopsis rifamycinica TaxID=287986 RepID=A0A066U1V4_9PSEU|nr:hypothetical protein DV20_32700 [Amycolatopsis rifamycinica]
MVIDRSSGVRTRCRSPPERSRSGCVVAATTDCEGIRRASTSATSAHATASHAGAPAPTAIRNPVSGGTTNRTTPWSITVSRALAWASRPGPATSGTSAPLAPSPSTRAEVMTKATTSSTGRLSRPADATAASTTAAPASTA